MSESYGCSPTAQRELGFSTTDHQLVVTAYALSFGGLLLVGGRISDLIGRRRAFITGLVGFAAASALGGAAPVFTVLSVSGLIAVVFGFSQASTRGELSSDSVALAHPFGRPHSK